MVVVYRKTVREFARAASRLHQITTYPVKKLPLDPRQPTRDLRELIADEKPEIVVALGPFSASLLARGIGGAPILFAYLTRPPTVTVRRGGWIAQGAAPEAVLRWVARISPGPLRLGVVAWDSADPLLVTLRRACAQRRCTPLAVHAQTPGQAVSAVFQLLRQRPDVIWLGHHVEPFTAAVLRQILRLQALTRVPVVGLTPFQVRGGLLLSVDASPSAVARTIAQMIRQQGAKWLLGDRRLSRQARRRGRLRRGRGRGESTSPTAEAAPLIQGRVTADRVTLNSQVAKALGIEPRGAVQAGATVVTQ